MSSKKPRAHVPPSSNSALPVPAVGVRLFKVLRMAGSQVCTTLWIVQVAAGVISTGPVTRQFTDELYARAWVLGVVEEPYQAFAGNFEEISEDIPLSEIDPA